MKKKPVKKAKKRNPQDLTLRNLRALKKAIYKIQSDLTTIRKMLFKAR